MTAACTVPGCTETTRVALCRTHTSALRDDLGKLERLGDELPTTIYRMARVAAGLGGGSSEPLLDWNEAAAAAEKFARRVLTRWILGDPPLDGEGTMIAQDARHIAKRLGYWRRLNSAGRLVEDVNQVVDRIEEVIDRARARTFEVGPCLEKPGDVPCDGTLVATVRDTDQLFPSELTCNSCGFTLPSTEWSRWARRVGKLKRIRTRGGKVVA